MYAAIPIPGFSDPISSISHLFGAIVFFRLSFPLLKLDRSNVWKTAALGVFCFASVFLLLVSGIYHLLSPSGKSRIIFQHLDHSAIFILIVGTMTPIHQILFKGFMRWGWLILIWVIAIATLTLKNIFFDTFPTWLGLTCFLALGWLGAVTGGIIWYKHEFAFGKLILFGGIAYTLGAILEFLHHPILIAGVLGPHELFHLCVLTGLGLHWRFIYKIAKPTQGYID